MNDDEPEKRQITRTEYHQLCGLLVLAQRHDRALDEIQGGIADLIGDREWASDVVRGGVADFDADELLRRIKIDVAE